MLEEREGPYTWNEMKVKELKSVQSFGEVMKAIGELWLLICVIHVDIGRF